MTIDLQAIKEIFVKFNLFSVFIGLIGISEAVPVHSYKTVDLANAARSKLYIGWQFDSAAYYFGKVLTMNKPPAHAFADYGWYLKIEILK